MSPADIGLVINTHLHFDHCGQNAVFKHAPVYVQRAELARSQRESPELYDWFGFMNARFELLDGDAEILPGLSVITTPATRPATSPSSSRRGRRPRPADRRRRYTPRQYRSRPARRAALPSGQAADVAAWQASLTRMHALGPARVHFCHHTDVLHG